MPSTRAACSQRLKQNSNAHVHIQPLSEELTALKQWEYYPRSQFRKAKAGSKASITSDSETKSKVVRSESKVQSQPRSPTLCEWIPPNFMSRKVIQQENHRCIMNWPR